jgi:hypothetical protein
LTSRSWLPLLNLPGNRHRLGSLALIGHVCDGPGCQSHTPRPVQAAGLTPTSVLHSRH